ncbi:cytochrome c3 family protein [Geobacter pickeringii]|uniref:Cytochrome C n=1 Tax=Geobacter pickeringii TaxID=345632 RepID=A0A0B5BKL5_9BACT|nr:cytochrome c3 family protein [Geobacter pickeringii]AJE04606.1 cytochrome C [Geobacter pickeringii]
MLRKLVVAGLMIGSAAGSAWGGMFECKECHSKKPGMVRMHQALQGRGCFGCHKMGERLMGKGESKDPAAVLKRRVTDSLCIECHKK